MKKILQLTDSLLQRLINTVDELPYEIREVVSILARCVKQKFNNEMIAKVGIGGILFLRFICPALTSPSLFGIVDGI